MVNILGSICTPQCDRVFLQCYTLLFPILLAAQGSFVIVLFINSVLKTTIFSSVHSFFGFTCQ
jgi:hypothetical protein